METDDYLQGRDEKVFHHRNSEAQMNQFHELKCGFVWGAAEVVRGFSDERKQWVTLIVRSKKHPRGIQIYVSKTGKARIHSEDGEWMPPASKTKRGK